MLNWRSAMVRVPVTIIAICVLALAPRTRVEAAGKSTIRVEDITSRSGVDFFADSDPTPNKNQPETMLSGVGLIDYDNDRSEEHTSELQSRFDLVCRLLLEKKMSYRSV